MDITKRGSVKEYLRQNKMRTSSGVYPVLDEAIKEMLKKACLRAAANGRQTVMGQDV